MVTKIDEIVKLYHRSTKDEKLIFIDLLNDLLNFDLQKKLTPPNSLGYRYYKDNYEEKIIKYGIEMATKQLGEKQVKHRLNNFWEILTEESFGTSNLGTHNTISNVPTGKIKNFSKDLQELIDNNKLSLGGIYSTRKLLLKRFEDFGLIILEKKNDENLKLIDIYKIIEKNPDNDPFFKMLNGLLEENKKIFGEELHNKDLKLLEGIENKFDKCRFNKNEVEKILAKVGPIQITFNEKEQKIYYMGEEIHHFKEKTLNYHFFRIMFSFPKGAEVDFKKFYKYYDNDDYYNNIDNNFISKKIVKLKGRCNTLIKKKTKKDRILMFSQIKVDNNRFLIRNY